jgi:hypothetical protein
VPIGVFFPEPQPQALVNALLSATDDLDEEELDEITQYAAFRRARRALKKAKRKS